MKLEIEFTPFEMRALDDYVEVGTTREQTAHDMIMMVVFDLDTMTRDMKKLASKKAP